MDEWGRLLSGYRGNTRSRVRIPASPPCDSARVTLGRFLFFDHMCINFPKTLVLSPKLCYNADNNHAPTWNSYPERWRESALRNLGNQLRHGAKSVR